MVVVVQKRISVVKQYIFYRFRAGTKYGEISKVAAKAATSALLSKCNSSTSIEDYYPHSEEHRFFIDIEPKSDLQEWLVNGREIEMILVHSAREIEELENILDADGIIYETIEEFGDIMLATEPINEDCYKIAIAQKESLLSLSNLEIKAS
jgi:hypothetical protein